MMRRIGNSPGGTGATVLALSCPECQGQPMFAAV